MKARWLVAIIAVSSTASADPLTLESLPGPGDRPEVAASERACERADSPGLLQSLSRTINGTRVVLLHQCGGVPAISKLAIQTAAGWFVLDGNVVEDVGANMTDFPVDVHFVRESIEPGTLADGSSAIVAVTVTRRDNMRRCHVVGCREAVVATTWMADVAICAASADEVRCAALQYVCPTDGCKRVTLHRGELATVERRAYAIDAAQRP